MRQGEGTEALEGGGGVWDPMVCAPAMARQVPIVQPIDFGKAPRREADRQPSSQSGSQLGKQAGRQAGRNTQFGFFEWRTTASNSGTH